MKSQRKKTKPYRDKIRFVSTLAKAGWQTYKHFELGLILVNAAEDELPLIEKITGLKCRVVEVEHGLARITYV